jgi:hypothetical protein
MTFTALLIDRADIRRRAESEPDAYGNVVQEWDTIEEGVPCRLDETVGAENIDDRETTIRTGIVFFKADADVQALDELDIDNATWRVIGPPARRKNSHSLNHVEARVEAVKL